VCSSDLLCILVTLSPRAATPARGQRRAIPTHTLPAPCVTRRRRGRSRRTQTRRWRTLLASSFFFFFFSWRLEGRMECVFRCASLRAAHNGGVKIKRDNIAPPCRASPLPRTRIALPPGRAPVRALPVARVGSGPRGRASRRPALHSVVPPPDVAAPTGRKKKQCRRSPWPTTPWWTRCAPAG